MICGHARWAFCGFRRVSMSVTFNNTKLLSNLKRQSLRLAKHLDMPQNQVQMLLAKHFYKEKSLVDIKRKINSNKYSGLIFLAAMEPDADEDVLNKFVEVLPELLIELSTSPISQIIKVTTKQLIIDVFSLKPSFFVDNGQ